MLVEPMTEAPEQTVVITFDDGFADFAEHALPVLTGYELTSTMYVVTGCVGSTSTWLESVGEGDRPMLGWSDIESLAKAGVEIGAHTHSHPQLDIINRDTAWEEIRRSRGVLQDRLGHEIPSFAYPFGFHGPRIRALVERAGFTSACAVKDALSGPGDDPLAIARVIVPGDTGGRHARRPAGRAGAPAGLAGRAHLDQGVPGRPAQRRPRPQFAGRLRTDSNGRKDCRRECAATEANARPMTRTEAEPMVPRTTRRRQRRSEIRRARRQRRRLVLSALRRARRRGDRRLRLRRAEERGRRRPRQGRAPAQRGLQRHEAQLEQLVPLLPVVHERLHEPGQPRARVVRPRPGQGRRRPALARGQAPDRSPGSTTGSSTTSRA